MEKMEIRKKKAEGLDMQELEAHSRAELLPDRIEMRRHRKKNRRRNGLGGGGETVASFLPEGIGDIGDIGGISGI
jgi:hypothetical protein